MNEIERNTEVLKAKAFDTIHDLIDDMWDFIDNKAGMDNIRIATLGEIHGVVIHTMHMIEAIQNGE